MPIEPQPSQSSPTATDGSHLEVPPREGQAGEKPLAPQPERPSRATWEKREQQQQEKKQRTETPEV